MCPGRVEEHKRPSLSRAPPSLQDTEIINTAILTGRTVAIPVKVIAIEVTGLVLDVSALVECESDNEDIIKVGFLEMGAPWEKGLRPSGGTETQARGEFASQTAPCGRQEEEKLGGGGVAGIASGLRG